MTTELNPLGSLLGAGVKNIRRPIPDVPIESSWQSQLAARQNQLGMSLQQALQNQQWQTVATASPALNRDWFNLRRFTPGSGSPEFSGHGHYTDENRRLIERSVSRWYVEQYGFKHPPIHWRLSGTPEMFRWLAKCEWKHDDVRAFLYRHRVIVLVARPQMMKFDDDRGRLHCADGPALRWPSGREEFYIHGAHVPRWIVEHPEWTPIKRIKDERNAEVRRMLIDGYIRCHGHGKFIEKVGAVLLNEDSVGKLWGVKGMFWSDYQHTIAEVLNKTPEPDGSFKTYHIICPPGMSRCKEAIAWTFNMSENEYELAAES